MRTNGLVGSLIIGLALAGHGQGADQTDSAISSEIREAAFDDSGGGDQPAIGCECSNPPIAGDGWQELLIGSCAYHVDVGTEFTALHVHTLTGGRITLSLTDTTAPGVATVSTKDESGVDDWGYAPRVWLGAQITNKWGVRGRYWRLSDTDVHFPDLTPGTTPTGTNFATIFTTDHMDAWTSDVEVVRSDEVWGFKFDGFVGGRHAFFETDSDLLAFGVFTTGNFVNLTLQNGSSFNGTGVTYGGSVRRQLFFSHLYGFGGVRASHLDGLSTSFGRADGTVASSPSAPLVGAATVTRNGADATMDIFEVQAGLEYEWCLHEIPANFFFRIAYEYQKWNIDGLPTGGAGFGGTIGELTTNSFASAGLGDMTLHGVSIGTGLTW